MSNTNQDEKAKSIKTAACYLSAAIFFAAVSLTIGLYNIKGVQRTVTVRGLAEQEVEADLAVWPLTFSLGGNDLLTLQKDISAKQAVIIAYLQKFGLTGTDVIIKEPAITDTSTNPYMNQNDSRFRYIAKTTVLVRSTSVNSVQKAVSSSLDLLGQGIAITRDYDSQVTYFFTALNQIKPNMIAEATKNARTAAEQFARDSKSKVGKIKTASQGLFTIEDASPGLAEKKSVRVVTSVEYFLAD